MEPYFPALLPNKASSARAEFHPFELLVKESSRNPQTTKAVAKTIGCSPQTDSKASLLKTTLIELIEHGEVKLMPTQNLHSHVLVTWKGIQQATKREM